MREIPIGVLGVKKRVTFPNINIRFCSQYRYIKIDLAANTARVTTSHRQIVEQLNVRLYQLKLAGVHHEIPHQYLEPSGSNPTPQQPVIFVWLCVIDCVYRRKSV